MSEALRALERDEGNDQGRWPSAEEHAARSGTGGTLLDLVSALPGVRRARRCLGVSARRVRGRIVSADVDRVVVDLGGAQGIAPRQELDLDWLLAGPRPGRRFRGYVTAIEDEVVMLSRFGREQRRRRAQRREAALAAMTGQLDEPVERGSLPGLVLTTGEEGALVALEDGLITGLVPALALASRPYVTAGRRLQFRVIGQPQDPERGIDVLLWPQIARV